MCWRQILFNIIGNAIKFTENGEVNVNVMLVADKNNKAVLRFSVRDTGIGIPADKTGMVFDCFTQVDASISRQFGGTGLGLTIARALVTAMGGTIGVKSTPGKGTVFWFVLPFERQKPEVSFVLPHLNLAGTRILVVDDNANARLILARQLRSWKINVATAAGAAEALAQLRSAAKKKKAFKAVIVDMCMPGISGLMLGQAIKADAALKKTILLLATSAVIAPELFKRCLRVFAAVMPKPILPKQLFESLLVALKKTKIKSAAALNSNKICQAGKRLHILVVDDNQANQFVIANMLKTIGHVARTVASGREAVKALERKAYDLVLMDIQMPGMDGLQATTMIRDSSSAVRDHAVPILAITAHALQNERDKCLASGMNGYLVKPIGLSAMAEAIARVTSPGNTPVPCDNTAAVDDQFVVFDSRTFVGRLGGKVACLRNVIKITLDEMPQLMRKFVRAVKKRQMEVAGGLAHNLRGAAANVSGDQFVNFTIKLEKACKAGAWREVDQLLPELSRQFAVLAREMREYLRKLNLPATPPRRRAAVRSMMFPGTTALKLKGQS